MENVVWNRIFYLPNYIAVSSGQQSHYEHPKLRTEYRWRREVSNLPCWEPVDSRQCYGGQVAIGGTLSTGGDFEDGRDT